MAEKIYDVIIVGSGPAGLTAAIYAARGDISTLILGGEKWGGQLMLTTAVENFPGFSEGIQGPDLMSAMRKQAEKFGAEFIEKNAVNVKTNVKPFEVLDNEGKIYKSRTIVVSSGALTQWLNIPGEKELIGRGISTCAPCDAPFYKEKIVAVVGGGDSAMEEANVLTKYASKVYLIHRRDGFKASKAMQDKILTNSKIEILWNTEIKKIIGEKKVEKIELFNNKTNDTSELQLDGVFVAIGHKPDSDTFREHLKMDEKGFIKNDFDKYHSETSVPGIFVAGDVMDAQYKQAITAAGMGCMAGMDVISYLENEVSK